MLICLTGKSDKLKKNANLQDLSDIKTYLNLVHQPLKSLEPAIIDSQFYDLDAKGIDQFAKKTSTSE